MYASGLAERTDRRNSAQNEGHVEPPAVGAEVDPVPTDVPKELADGRRVGVKLGECVQAPPGVVPRGLRVVVGVHRPAVDGEPIQVGRILAVLQDVVELEESPARVVEHAVEHDLEPLGMGSVNQSPERGVSAEHGVDPEIVVGVVAVVRGRLEDRREIDRVDAEIGQVIQVFEDPVEVAPLVPVGGGRVAPGVKVGRLGNREASREAVRKDLIKDRVADPVGRLGVGHRRLRGVLGALAMNGISSRGIRDGSRRRSGSGAIRIPISKFDTPR